ncbi:hypothetical protein RRG08_025115 [Elysia crispata]|uniref:Uncharacterized protein n=1 Tax=Elysia crispata TaxID=231223 RepID=A0AAE1AIA8_9GAST|nr:hypothetical protein RRG08_025115 [Elysia crispata]
MPDRWQFSSSKGVHMDVNPNTLLTLTVTVLTIFSGSEAQLAVPNDRAIRDLTGNCVPWKCRTNCCPLIVFNGQTPRDGCALQLTFHNRLEFSACIPQSSCLASIRKTHLDNFIKLYRVCVGLSKLVLTIQQECAEILNCLLLCLHKERFREEAVPATARRVSAAGVVELPQAPGRIDRPRRYFPVYCSHRELFTYLCMDIDSTLKPVLSSIS